MLEKLTLRDIDLADYCAADDDWSLQDFHARLNRAVTSADVSRVLVEAGLNSAEASAGALVLLTEDRKTLRVGCALGDDGERVEPERRLPLSANSPLAEVVRSRQELWLASRAALTARYPTAARFDDSIGWVALPLMVDGIILGSVGWSFRERPLTVRRRERLRSIARSGGVALYRAGLFDSERRARMQAEVARFEAGRRDRFMAQVSETLDIATDTPNAVVLLGNIARLTLPMLGQWCAINELDDSGRLHQLVATHFDPARDRLLDSVTRLHANRAFKLPANLARGDKLAVEISADARSPSVGLHPRLVQALGVVGLKRLVVLPMRVHGHTLGTLCLAGENATPARLETDLALAERVARRCAAVLEYLRLHDAAAQAEQARENFVAATSHELRTPLSHIKGFVSTLRNPETAWDKDMRDDFLAEIEHETDRLAHLVDTLLDIARLDSGGLGPGAQKPTPPAVLIQAGIDRVRAVLGDRSLSIQLPNDLPQVLVDASQVERVIANLLENAAKYAPPSETINVVGKLANNTVMFRIEDRGLGIPASHLESVFQPFFREPNGDLPAKPGSGLGLAICRSIVRSQNGRIWAEPRPGGGTAIVFTLPIVKQVRSR